MQLQLAVLCFILATFVSAASVVTIPLTKLRQMGTYLKGSPDADRARAALLKSRTTGGPTTIPVTNLAYIQYTTSVGIGDPPTYYNLIVDTGSSNTFCGTGTAYAKTSTSIFTGQNFQVIYGVGDAKGLEYLDRVILGGNLVITNQSIGDALSFDDFKGVDGILGVGPTSLTLGTLSPNSTTPIPTVMDNLSSQGLINSKVLGVHFAPPAKHVDKNGALTYGGVDPTLYEGELTFTPVTETFPAGHYWGINVTSVTFGPHTIISTPTAGIVDTGTTQILLADDLLDLYVQAIPGAALNESMGLIEIPPSSVASMQPLNFTIGGRVFSMDVSTQLIPEYENGAWGGYRGRQYLVLSPLGSPSGSGLDFILGQKFIERYYVLFDADAKRVGLAETGQTF